jgi:hypothetical protein
MLSYFLSIPSETAIENFKKVFFKKSPEIFETNKIIFEDTIKNLNFEKSKNTISKI